MEKTPKRGPNFTTTECSLLTQIVKNHMNIIENKKTDAITWKEKKACWEKIASEFNCVSINIPRSADTLRKKCDNIKTTIKEKMTGQRKYALGTGGGPPLPSPKLSDEEKSIFDIIQIQVTGIQSFFDSDKDADNSHGADITAPTINSIAPEAPQSNREEVLTIDIPEPLSSLPECSNWSTYSPSILRTPRAPQLETNITHDFSAPRKPNEQYVENKENPLRRYRKRPYTAISTNKAWSELAEQKKLVAKMKMDKLKKEIELTEVLIKQNKLKNKLLELQIERETKHE